MKKIVKGNDFTMRVIVNKIVDGEQQPFSLPACEEVKALAVGRYRRYELQARVDAKDDSVLLVRVEGDKLPLGKYALEVKGKLFGNDWRSNEYCQFALVDSNAEADTEFRRDLVEGEDSVEMDTAIVFLPPDVALKEYTEILRKENAGAEQKRVSSEEKRQEAEEERVTAESERVKAEQKRVSSEEKRQEAEEERAKAEELRQKNKITVDNELSETSENAVQNKIITSTLNEHTKQFNAVRNSLALLWGQTLYGGKSSTDDVKVPEGVTDIVLPNSVTSIGNGAFYGCTSLASITIPNSVTSIGNGAFYSCTSLASITIPNSVTSIGNYAFYGCMSLAELWLPLTFDLLTSIDLSISSWGSTDKGLASLRWTFGEGADDRTAKGLQPLTVRLSSNSFNLLTEEERAAALAKGYTITK